MAEKTSLKTAGFPGRKLPRTGVSTLATGDCHYRRTGPIPKIKQYWGEQLKIPVIPLRVTGLNVQAHVLSSLHNSSVCAFTGRLVPDLFRCSVGIEHARLLAGYSRHSGICYLWRFVAGKLRMDPFGVLVLGVVTA